MSIAFLMPAVVIVVAAEGTVSAMTATCGVAVGGRTRMVRQLPDMP